MKTTIPAILLASLVLLLLSAGPAPGVTIAFVPASTTIVVGYPLSIDLVISGLETPTSVSAFDLTVAFDKDILQATDVAFGAYLGNPSPGEAISDFTIFSGSVNFAEVSLLAPATLDNLQPGSFGLVTLTFEVVGSGFTTLSFVPGTVPGVPGLAVHDAFGDVLPVTGSDGAVTAIGTAIPEPTPVLLVMAGSALIQIVARRQRRTDG
jgi:hypothetical protein